MRNSTIALLALLASLHGSPLDAQKVVIAVEISPAQPRAKEGEAFAILTKVRNNGLNTQVMVRDACSYSELWISSSDTAHIVPTACTKPGFTGAKLKPGETYTAELQAYAKLTPGPTQSEEVTFRLGLRSEFQDEKYPPQPSSRPQTLWSNSITIEVERASSPPRPDSLAKTSKPADNNGTGGGTVTHVCRTTHYDPSRKHLSAILLTGTQVQVEKSGYVYNAGSNSFEGTVTVTNQSPKSISGPLQVLFDSLADGVTVAKANGDFSCWSYVTIPNAASLGPGESASVNVQFSNPNNKRIDFIPLVYSGIFD